MRALGFLVAAWAATACDRGTAVCTEELRAVFVTAVDSVDQPVPGASVSHVLPRTLTAVTVPQDPALVQAGRYVVFSDAVLPQLDSTLFRVSGEAVRMTGIAGPTAFVADYVFDVPDGCHVRKVSGPDTVVLQ